MNALIKPTSDRKTRFYDGQKNTFGLLPGAINDGGTCPGCTTERGGCWFLAPGRRTHECYVDKLMLAYGGVEAVLKHNTDLLMNSDIVQMTDMLDAEFTRFEVAEVKRRSKTGEPMHADYRLHWSGDVFSPAYAQALKQAMERHPSIRFWTYTRSFWAVPVLHSVPNLNLYLSLDPVNAVQGLITYAENNGPASDKLQICYMSKTHDIAPFKPEALARLKAMNAVGAVLGLAPFPVDWLAELKLVACPVDSNQLQLEGGCATCKRCLTRGKRPVWFAS